MLVGCLCIVVVGVGDDGAGVLEVVTGLAEVVVLCCYLVCSL